MNTPVADFVKDYAYKDMVRFHMPGHKGNAFVGCETYDITEIQGADALYEAEGIIAESEKNAGYLFGTGKTLYSTEGSSQCIKAMLYLSMTWKKRDKRPYVIAARNVHKSFLYAAALLDLDVVWLWPKETDSVCSCPITEGQIEDEINMQDELPVAVYLTSPDYLGGIADIEGIAKVCHKYGTLLLVDNAHGAYLKFINLSRHPIDCGADMCCDSAHKTLPVLTGGAYLHLQKNLPGYFLDNAKNAMALFGSTSPSYLTLMSLDMCNAYLEERYTASLMATVEMIKDVKKALQENDWEVAQSEPLKIVIKSPQGANGEGIARMLRRKQIECEYADRDYVVFMITPENSYEELEALKEALGKNHFGPAKQKQFTPFSTKQEISIRKAMFSPQEKVSIKEAEGRICGAPLVSCPPAIPIMVCGEVISKEAVKVLSYYDIEDILVTI